MRLALNMDSDKEYGSLVLRPGVTKINGSKLSDNYPCLGIHNFRDSVGSGSKLFAVFNDGTNNDIYDVVAGTKSLENDTAALETNFLTYLDAALRLNGTDNPKYYSGSAWVAPRNATFTATAATDVIASTAHGLSNGEIIKVSSTTTLPAGLSANTAYYIINKNTNDFQVSLTSGGAAVDITSTGSGTHTWKLWDTFDLSNFPSGARLVIEFKDRVWTGGYTSNPDRVDASGIADSTLRNISWTENNLFILLEQEDGGGGLTAFAKVPGYLLFFKKRTMKRYDGFSTYPDDMVNQGAPSQKAVAQGKGMVGFVNGNGAWLTTGGMPKNICTYMVEEIIKSVTAANMLNATARFTADEKHLLITLPSATVSGETYSNVMLKYNILNQTWDVRAYAMTIRAITNYVDTDGVEFIVFGDGDGDVHKLNIGTTDNGTAITYSFETQDIDFGYRGLKKGIERMFFFTEYISKGQVYYRLNSGEAVDWKPLGNIKGVVQEFEKLDLRANYYNFKITEATDTGLAKILGFDIAEGTKVYDNGAK